VSEREYGIYIHVPFCRQRCDYCAFVTSTDHDHLIDRYVDACVAQLARERLERSIEPSSVFFGGGTPSRLSGD
jgi:oxygen-independent coproporphyrinogen III oxidase